MNLPTMEEKRKERDLITTFKFLNENDDVEGEQFSEISRERSTRSHTKKPSKKHVRKDIKKSL